MTSMTFSGSAGFEYPASADVVIIGAGLSGTLAAALLARSCVSVVLLDRYQIYPPQFRAEQLVGSQVATLTRLGLLDSLVPPGTVPAERAVAVRGERIVGGVSAPHYGMRHDAMVKQARQQLPPSVRIIIARVEEVTPASDRQRVTLNTGEVLTARLVVIATGFGQQLMGGLGMSRTKIRTAQSLAFGFDVECASLAWFQSNVLVAYGEPPAGAIDYLTLFMVGTQLRANLFTYGDHRNAWTKRFVREPVETLREAMPCLEQMTGSLRARGQVQVRVNDLMRASEHRRDGIVLIGDAFQTSCPAAGTGIGRLLNDIDRLCHCYVPRWLATPGMDVSKINQFYDDPIKQSCDTEALRVAAYRRSLMTETGVHWKLHRRRIAVQNRIRRLAQRKMRPNAITDASRELCQLSVSTHQRSHQLAQAR